MNDNERDTFSAIGFHAMLILNRLQTLRALQDCSRSGNQNGESEKDASSERNYEPQRDVISKLVAA